jgi:2-dehydropantoate 2-reductase
VRVAVVGAGAIGSTYAWFLARAGHAVAVADVREDHLEVIARDGLVAELPEGEESVRVATTAGPADLVIVATKSFATRAAAETARGLLDDETLLATVQNGVGNVATIASVVGPARVLPGSTTVAAEQGGPGRVRIGAATAAGRSLTVLGPPAGVPELLPRVERLCEELTAAGLPAQAVLDGETAVWRKLAFAGSMAPISAVLGLTVAETVAHARPLVETAIEEIVAVARACGADLDAAETRAAAFATFELTGPHRASMAVDVAEGRRTEIDAMCLEVARLGRGHGVATPVNDVVGELVRALELSRR